MELLQEKKISIGGKEYPFKKSIRAMIEFETMSGHSIASIESLKDMTMFFYCTLKACGAGFTYDEFLNLIDDQPEKLNEFSAMMLTSAEKKREIQ